MVEWNVIDQGSIRRLIRQGWIQTQNLTDAFSRKFAID